MIKTAVSLYSYQDEYVRGKLDLEGCLRELHAAGAQGVEILPDQMLPKAPCVSDADVRRFRDLCDKYELTPVCNDIFINTKLYANRILTHDESLELLKQELRLAHRMGMHLVRLVSMTPVDIIEDALPLAEKLDVVMALEVHAGMSFGIPQTKKFCDLMMRLDSPYVGLVIDTGIFCRKFPRVSREFFLAQGLNPDLAKFIEEQYAQHEDISFLKDKEKAPACLKDMVKSELDFTYLMLADGYENHPYTILDPYMKYVKHFHCKTFEMLSDHEEYSTDFAGLIDYLQQKHFDGYIATEYEGGRFALPGTQVDAVSQVRLNQKMMLDCLARSQKNEGGTEDVRQLRLAGERFQECEAGWESHRL